MTEIQSSTRQQVPSATVGREVRECVGVREVSDSVAVTIASWWQSSGTEGSALASLASGCAVDSEDVLRDVAAARRQAPIGPEGDFDRLALDMLGTWTIAKARNRW